jgi:hypothetical protein
MGQSLSAQPKVAKNVGSPGAKPSRVTGPEGTPRLVPLHPQQGVQCFQWHGNLSPASSPTPRW